MHDETSTDSTGNASVERLSRQRALLNEKLGLTQAAKLGVNISEMITDDDMRTGNEYNVNEEKVNY